MKRFVRLIIALGASTGLALIATAGPAPIETSKESKEMVAPAPPACDWSGVYLGLHVGGQFGHSQTNDLDEYYLFAHHHFGYSESGVVAGGQVGYNFQFARIVLGPEFDLGYMNLDGSGIEPQRPLSDTWGEAHGKTDSDFYLTLRGRIGYALDWHGCWLLYGTGGAIGVNYDTGFATVNQNMMMLGINTSKRELNWGPTVGGGIERQIGRHWSIKFQYLWFTLDEQSFSGLSSTQMMMTSAPRNLNAPHGAVMERYRFEGETQGHIFQGGLNFRF